MFADCTIYVNQAVRREVYQVPTVEETLGSLTEGSVFSKLDANSGFHQIVLNPESAKLTTFVTPFGRYMFKRLPFGILSAPEYFQKRMDKELSGIEGVKCRMDDILVIGRDQAQHDQRLKQVLDGLAQRKLMFNLEKCSFSQSRMQYLGQIIDSEGIRKHPSKVKAINDMAEPQDIASLRHFLGLVNHLMKFCPNLTEKMMGLGMGPSPTRSLSTAESRLASEQVLHCMIQKRRPWSHLMPAVLDLVLSLCRSSHPAR